MHSRNSDSFLALQGVGLTRLIVGTRPTLALLEAYCTRLAMRLGREPAGYPIRHARPGERFGIRGTIPLARDASLKCLQCFQSPVPRLYHP